MNRIQKTGAQGIGAVKQIASFTAFLAKSVYNWFAPPFYPKETLAQVLEIGFYSLPVVALTAMFAGMVLAMQSYSGFASFSASSAVPTVVVVSITRELGPVFAGLMVAGRIGATQAANIGAMRVTEQIDALSTMSTNPFKYIIAPRMVAAVIAMPFLVLIADIIGVFGGFAASVGSLDFNPYIYVKNTWTAFEAMDAWVGMVKAMAFGLIISAMGCYFGYTTKGGAEGVGKSTTNAVVMSSILILISNYMITAWFLDK
ncbi:MAG: ABC transporter permease [Rickettsiales bacterium]|jgi:phospholipid/cholesterol/gamma-HCH transport system permease protein|nr:ABC transporter permease [Rickettsiales bacterium]